MAIRKRSVWYLAPLSLGLLAVGLQGLHYSQQKLAMETIEGLGGRVLTTQGEPGWLRRLTGQRSLKFFERGTVVNLSETTVADADLALLKKLHGLERLNLHQTPVTDLGLVHLETLTDLKALDLSRTRITGSGLKSLRDLARLEYLYLRDTPLDDGDLVHLQGLKNLRHLDVSGTPITAAGIAKLQRDLPAVDVER